MRTPSSRPRTRKIRILLIALTTALSWPEATAGITTKVVTDSTVFRVGEEGRAYVAGKVRVGELVEIVGLREDFPWVRIRFQEDEGYLPKSSLETQDINKDYFDPAADKLGRRKPGGPNSLALINSKKSRPSRPGLVANLAYNTAYGVGAGGGLIYSSFSWERPGYDFGVDGVFFFMNDYQPFTSYLFYRYWTPGEVKLGLEGFLSLSSLAVQVEDQEPTAVISAGAGGYIGFPLSSKVLLTPGVRLNVWGGIEATGIFAMALSL
jgi:hypothetical protein